MRLGSIIRVIICARDMEAMVAFYRDVLLLRIKDDRRQIGWVVFEAGPHTELALHGGATARSTEWAPKVVMSCDDIAAFREYLRSKAVVIGELQEWEGQMYLDLSDPEGNDLQLVMPKAGR